MWSVVLSPQASTPNHQQTKAASSASPHSLIAAPVHLSSHQVPEREVSRVFQGSLHLFTSNTRLWNTATLCVYRQSNIFSVISINAPDLFHPAPSSASALRLCCLPEVIKSDPPLGGAAIPPSSTSSGSESLHLLNRATSTTLPNCPLQPSPQTPPW